MIEAVRFQRIRRTVASPAIADPAAATRAALVEADLLAQLEPDATVAIAISSRRIVAYDDVLGAAVAYVEGLGLRPIVVGAMGSHGGATEAGQRALLEKHGIDERSVGAPIDVSQDVVHVGDAEPGLPVHAPPLAAGADAIIVINRIRPHTAFGGELGSGLAKMVAIGLGRAAGARAVHAVGLRRGLGAAIRVVAERALELLPVVGGVGLVENGHGQLARIAALPATRMLEEEGRLLCLAAYLRPSLGHEEIDLLVVDRVGKDISGTGLDPWVIGRLMSVGEPEPPGPRIRRIYARSLSPLSNGNAHGVGLVDFVHRRLADAIDWDVTRLNALTAGAPQKARLPIVMTSDRAALDAALATAGVEAAAEARVVHVSDTGKLGELNVSSALVDEATSTGAELVGDCQTLSFDESGDFSMP